MIKLDTKMPSSCANCFACGMHDLTHNFRCRLTGEELPEIKFYELLAKKNPKMKNCPLQEDRATELKPCPFCGSEVKIKKSPLWHEYNGIMHGYKDCYEFEISCSKCGCSTYRTKADTVSLTEDMAKNTIIKNWNERKEYEV